MPTWGALKFVWTAEDAETECLKSRCGHGRACGHKQAIGGLWQQIKDLDGLAKSSAFDRQLGMSGVVLHPMQVETINRTYADGRGRRVTTRGMIEALDAAQAGRASVMYEVNTSTSPSQDRAQSHCACAIVQQLSAMARIREVLNGWSVFRRFQGRDGRAARHPPYRYRDGQRAVLRPDLQLRAAAYRRRVQRRHHIWPTPGQQHVPALALVAGVTVYETTLGTTTENLGVSGRSCFQAHFPWRHHPVSRRKSCKRGCPGAARTPAS